MTGQTFEIPAEMRAAAEKSVEQARAAAGTVLDSAVKVSEQMRSTSQSVQASMRSVVAKGLDQVQQNAAATFDFAQKLVRARDAHEALTLQTEFLRSQFANLQAQAKDLGALTRNTLAQATARQSA